MDEKLHKWMVSLLSPGPRHGFSRPVFAFVTVLLAAVLTLGGCHKVVTDPQDPHFIVAEKGDWTITRAQLDEEISTYLRQSHKTLMDVGPAKMPLLETSMLHFMVLKKLLLDKAATLQLKDVDKDETAALQQLKDHYPSQADFETKLKAAGITLDALKKQIHEQILIRKTMEAEAFQDVEPTDPEINDFYLQHKDKFNIPEKIRASRVVVLVDEKTSAKDKTAKKKAIDKARARVVKGEDFSKVATEVSEDRYSAPKGGDIGYFQKGENEPEFDTVAFATKAGDVSPVFETPMGYQFLKVTDVHAGGDVSIAEARDTISKYLRQMKEAQKEEAYTKKTLADSGVIFHLVNPIPDAGTNATSNAVPPAPPSAPPAALPPTVAPATNAAPQ